MHRTGDPHHVFNDDPLSSAAMRFALFPKASPDGPGPRLNRPFGLWHTESRPLPQRQSVNYCHRLQVAVDDAGRPLVEQLDDDSAKPNPPKPKKWDSKTYSDGDEGQEEDNWGWEEQ